MRTDAEWSADFAVENHGSIVLIRPLTEECRMHLKENVDAEAQWWSGALTCEPRYVADLVAALVDEGFSFREGEAQS